MSSFFREKSDQKQRDGVSYIKPIRKTLILGTWNMELATDKASSDAFVHRLKKICNIP